MRIALGVEYDGSAYHGWQSQTGLHTVQSVVENALSTVADDSISVVCAGRTDTGVHASNQVIHLDAPVHRTLRGWINGTNAYLPKDVCVKWAIEVPETFNARYSAEARRYRYVIFNSSIRPALFRSNVTWNYRPLNHYLMAEAAQYLIGEKDFTSFRSIECQSKTPMRRVMNISVHRIGHLIIIDIMANAFLHHMVRNIAGVLMAVGSGKKEPSWVKEILEAKDRRLGAETAPPYGLYLVDVLYPRDFGIKKQALGPLFLPDEL